MKFQTIVFALTLASTTAQGGQSVNSCLSTADPKNCLADAAVAALATDKDAVSRIDGAAALITTLAKSNLRRDDILAIAKDDETAPISSRWTLAVSRNTYAFRFGLPSESQDHPARINSLGKYLRSRTDGMDRFGVIIAACEALDRESKQAQEKWNGALDGFCSMAPSDADAMEREFPGLSVISEPLVDAYQNDRAALGKSLDSSIALLDRYQQMLNSKMPAKEREFIHGMIFLGHIFNAWALATANQGVPAVKATEIALDNLRKTPSADQAKEFQLVKSMTSWIYAKAGMRDEAMRMIKASLDKIDKKKNVSGGDIAAVLAMVIETLQELESRR